jgi:hypothetical protein
VKRVFALLLIAAACATAPKPNPALRTELLAMRDADQVLRKRWIAAGLDNQPLKAEVAALDAKHVARLTQIIDEVGWPGKSLVGPDGANAAWLIAQHGGKEFLHKVLPLMKKAAARGELNAASYALSEDRVRIQDGKKQIYGSQFNTRDGKCEPLPIEDPEHVDERRRSVKLDLLADYAADLCKMYGLTPTMGH